MRHVFVLTVFALLPAAVAAQETRGPQSYQAFESGFPKADEPATQLAAHQ